MSAPTAPSARRASRWKIALSTLVIAVVIAIAALARTGTAHKLAARLGIRIEREAYTALSFVHPDTLGYHGVSYQGRQVHDRLRFSVRNEEHHRERYRWTISFAPHGRRYQGALEVAAGASATVGRRVLLPCARLTAAAGHSKHPPRVQVRVQLKPTREAIDYWQVCGG